MLVRYFYKPPVVLLESVGNDEIRDEPEAEQRFLISIRYPVTVISLNKLKSVIKKILESLPFSVSEEAVLSRGILSQSVSH